MIPATKFYDSRNLWSARPRDDSRSPGFGSASPDEWLNAPSSLNISEREVHVWKIDLTTELGDPWAFLSDEEKARAVRFHFERDRCRFTTARHVLRILLGGYLCSSPGELQFDQTKYGKPFLTNPSNSSLRFNLSHSNDVALLAVTSAREVGIDVEFVREDFATEEVARRFFSELEVAKLMRLQERLQKRAFFNCWTRKEAYVKARGEGLSMPLDTFDVSLAPDSVAAMLCNRMDESEVSGWLFHHIAVDHEHVGALVIEATASPLQISRFQFGN